MTEHATGAIPEVDWVAVQKRIIKRLLNGWQPNHSLGNPIRQWWHPYKPYNSLEDMDGEEFFVLRIINAEMEHEQ